MKIRFSYYSSSPPSSPAVADSNPEFDLPNPRFPYKKE
jgi:hypothetical protein